MRLEEKLCDEEETVKQFTYFGDMVSASGGCEAAVTARTRCVWVMWVRRFPLRQKWAVYVSYVRPAILYGSEAWCLKENEMEILRRTERSMMRAMCGVQLKNIKRCTDLMFMLGFSETTELAMASSVRWYGHVLRREDGLVLRGAFDFEVNGQRKNGRPKRK